MRDDFQIRWLLSEVTRTKAEHQHERRSQVETAKVIATRRRVLSALEAFAAELARRRLPVPHAVNSDLRVLRALCGRGGWLTRPMSEGADERDADLEQREADLEQREAELVAREAALAERGKAAEAVLNAADERDAIADARDVTADRREKDHDLAELLASDGERGYGGHWSERRNAGLDRAESKEDRASSHIDRVALTEGDADNGTDET